MIYLTNSVPGPALIGKVGTFNPIHADRVRQILTNQTWESAIGHQSTADALTAFLGIEVPMRRITITLETFDRLIVCALRGPRLEEGQVLTREEVEARGFDFLEINIVCSNPHQEIQMQVATIELRPEHRLRSDQHR